MRRAAVGVVEQLQWWLSELGYATLNTPRAPRVGRVAYAAEWQLCRFADWVRGTTQ